MRTQADQSSWWMMICNFCCPCLVKKENDAHNQQSSGIPLQDRPTLVEQRMSVARIIPLKNSLLLSPNKPISTQIKPTIQQNNSSQKSPLLESLIGPEPSLSNIGNQGEQQEQFRTVNSGDSRSISRRTFKILARTAKSIQEDYSQFQVPSMDARLQDDTNDEYLLLEDDQQQFILRQFQWLHKQYHSLSTPFQKHDSLTKARIDSQSYFRTLICKMQDYNTFYYEDTIALSSRNSKNKPKGSFTAFQGSGRKNQKFMSLYTIQGVTMDMAKVLKWFNSIQIQSLLHCFQNTHIFPNSQHSPKCAILRSQQFDRLLRGTKEQKYIRQLAFVKFQGEKDPSLLQIDYSLDSNLYQCLIKIDGGDNGTVEIYTQCTYDLLCKPSLFFQTKWQALQTKIKRDHVATL